MTVVASWLQAARRGNLGHASLQNEDGGQSCLPGEHQKNISITRGTSCPGELLRLQAAQHRQAAHKHSRHG